MYGTFQGLRDDLIDLHRMAHKFINQGYELNDSEDLFGQAFDIELMLDEIQEQLDVISTTVARLADLAPDPDEDLEYDQDE